MSTVYDVEHLSIIDMDSVQIDLDTPINNVNVTPVPGLVNVIEVPVLSQVSVVEIVTEGPQGIPGLQNVFVGPTPPPNPNINDIWIDTST